MLDLTEKTIRREEKFCGRIFSVHVDEVLLPDGTTSTREVVEHVDGVAVLALDEERRVLMVTQYRYVFGKPLLELPAGKLDQGEEPETGALRELKEETGAVPGTLVKLCSVIPAPGCYGETLHLFFAKDLRMEAQQLDEGEFLNVERIPFDEMVRRCLAGEIEDAKTVTAVLMAKLRFDL